MICEGEVINTPIGKTQSMVIHLEFVFVGNGEAVIQVRDEAGAETPQFKESSGRHLLHDVGEMTVLFESQGGAPEKREETWHHRPGLAAQQVHWEFFCGPQRARKRIAFRTRFIHSIQSWFFKFREIISEQNEEPHPQFDHLRPAIAPWSQR